ncbi:MAG: hypothetical protein WDN31_02065 [Hyphomicrobium sp.]
MPPFGELIDQDQEVWKMIAWIRTLFKGRTRAAPLVTVARGPAVAIRQGPRANA